MPTGTPLIKVNRTKSYGAEVILHGDVYDDACAYAYKLAEEHGYTFVHPFDDLDVATGQGSIAMEIIQELPTVDYILVPIGGGGLITGVATLAKMLKQVTEENRQGEGQHLPGHTAFGQTVLVGFIHAVRSRLSV